MTLAINLAEVEYIAFRLAREKMIYDEPIPEFSTRFPNILESCLATPFQQFDKKSLYQKLTQKAAILFYLMIKNHPFQNGNKRIAMAAMFYFFYKNRKWLRVDDKKLYNFSVWLAQSPAELKDLVVEAADKFINAYLVDLT